MLSSISWKDIIHYGSGIGLLGLGLLAAAGIHIPGVTIDPTVTSAAAMGILAAGLKSTPLSGPAPAPK